MNFFESNRWISRTEAASPRELPHPTRTLPIVYPGDEQESKAFFKLVRGSSRRTREKPQARTGGQKSRTPHMFGGDLVLLALLLALRWAPCNCLSPWINSYTSKSPCLDILIFIAYCQFSELSNDTKPIEPQKQPLNPLDAPLDPDIPPWQHMISLRNLYRRRNVHFWCDRCSWYHCYSTPGKPSVRLHFPQQWNPPPSAIPHDFLHDHGHPYHPINRNRLRCPSL